MRALSRRLALLSGLLPLLFAGCATQAGARACEEYKPVPACSPGFTATCQTTPDGCEQCACVPTVDGDGRSPQGPPRK